MSEWRVIVGECEEREKCKVREMRGFFYFSFFFVFLYPLGERDVGDKC